MNQKYKDQDKMESKTGLHLRNELTYVYMTSFIVASLTAIVTIAGIIFRDHFYPTEALVQTFLPNDVINLFIGIPILIFSIFSARRAKLIGLLLWQGAIVYNMYNFIAYIYALPFSWRTIIYLSLVGLDSYILTKLVVSIDGEKLVNLFRKQVYEKFCGAILTLFGLLFSLRALIVFANATINGEILSRIEIAPNISDLIIAPAFIIVGISLWRKKALGYVSGLGLLFLASMLFFGLILFLILQPILTHNRFLLEDLIIVAVMSSVCFVPFSLFFRGALFSSRSLSL